MLQKRDLFRFQFCNMLFFCNLYYTQDEKRKNVEKKPKTSGWWILARILLYMESEKNKNPESCKK